jgi:hypothetical protein
MTFEEIIKVPDTHPDKYLDMPEGLEGYWWETNDQICVPVVIAKNEGDGSFSKFLRDIESKGKLIFFPTIVSAKLDAILRSRGYSDAFVIDKLMGVVDGLAKPKSGFVPNP